MRTAKDHWVDLRVLRAKARAKGMCVSCLRRRAVRGRVRCDACLEDNARVMRERRAVRRRAKLCVLCPERNVRLALKGRRLCAKCFARSNALREKRVGARRRAGTCLMCSEKRQPGVMRCPKHHRAKRETEARKRDVRRQKERDRVRFNNGRNAA